MRACAYWGNTISLSLFPPTSKKASNISSLRFPENAGSSQVKCASTALPGIRLQEISVHICTVKEARPTTSPIGILSQKNTSEVQIKVPRDLALWGYKTKTVELLGTNVGCL